MKWNEYPATKPEKEGFYVVKFDRKVNGFGYGYRSFSKCPDGEFRFTATIDDSNATLTHWGQECDFEESFEMLKRPSNYELVRHYLDQYTGKGLGDVFADLFTDEEMKQIIIEKMTNAQVQGIADDEWDDYCFVEDCRREDELWRIGHYG